MDFETFLKKIQNKKPSTAADYNHRVKKIENDFNLSLNSITVQDIDSIIDTIKDDPHYRSTHGNSHVSALNAYKAYIKHLLSLHIKQNLPFGNDLDRRYVYYDKDILPNEKVVDLSEHLENEYGHILEFISLMLRNNNNDLKFDYKKIKIILKKGHPVDTYTTSDNTIKEILKNKFKQNSLSEIDIDKIFSNKNIDVLRTGEYCHQNEDYHINLYYQNISCDNYDEFLVKIYSTLAHELMHYVHNLIVGDNVFCKNGFIYSCLKEAVADFVSFIYLFYKAQYNSSQYDSIVAKHKYDLWVNYFDYAYPYAKALYFINKYHDNFDDYINEDCKLKLQKVVRKSKTSLSAGYNLLQKL